MDIACAIRMRHALRKELFFRVICNLQSGGIVGCMTETVIPGSGSARGISFPGDVERDDHGEQPQRAKTRRPPRLRGFGGYC